MTNSVLVPARSIRAVFAQLSRRQGSSENGAVAANAVRTNAARRAGLQPVADDVADDQHGGVLRPFGHEVEVAADPLGGGGQEGRRQLQAGPLGQLGWGERVADRAQILELVLGRLQALAQHGEIPSRTAASSRRRAISDSWRCSRSSGRGCRAAEPRPRSAAAEALDRRSSRRIDASLMTFRTPRANSFLPSASSRTDRPAAPALRRASSLGR